MGPHAVSKFGLPDLGVGVGFRVPHYRQVINELPAMDFFEVISENFMGDGGSPRWHLDQLKAHYPVILHGVSACFGGPENDEHTARLLGLVDHVDPPWISDHLCWTGSAHAQSHDLLPLPYTGEVADHTARRVRRLQHMVGRPVAIENASSYATWKASTMTEWAFLTRVVEAADCAVLLDVNNVFVSSENHGFDPIEYLDGLPLDRVVQIHLAGHSVLPTHRLDTHDHPVCPEVWALYAEVIRRIGSVSTLIEWDDRIPSFERLQEEVETARSVRDKALAERARA
ncbi:MAG: DUF692 domain-containing protein [Proteobacteria bacterium]|nr:DUF692 domain-containing protein [Pseudomonadota bacterium]MCP4919759.1 DUF692 domain-containing protein [Pseudomonadota bacterium]